MSNLITLYDIPGYAAKDIAWSPNTWKARLVLNLKGLPYKTVWVEYPDIASVAESVGAEHTSISGYNRQYTCPFIQDPSTSSTIADSLKIAQYLDATYPDTLTIIPKGTAVLQKVFSDMFFEKVGSQISPYVNFQAMKQLSERSQIYWRKTREARFGMPLEDVAPEGSEKRAELWKTVMDGLRTINGWLSVHEGTGDFVMGEQPTWADIIIVSTLTWPKRILGENSQEWKEVMAVDNGRWAKLMKAFEQWEYVDKEGLKAISVVSSHAEAKTI